MKLVSVCAWCPPVEVAQGEQSHGICPSCLQDHFPEYAKTILARRAAQQAVEQANPLLVPQTW
jgi:hypothetical protein